MADGMTRSFVERPNYLESRHGGCAGGAVLIPIALSGLVTPRPCVKISDEHGEDAGEKNAVEGAGAADRSYRRAQSAHFVQIGEIGPNQRAQAAGDVGKRRGVGP